MQPFTATSGRGATPGQLRRRRNRARHLDGTGAESVIGGENLFTFGVAVTDTHVYN